MYTNLDVKYMKHNHYEDDACSLESSVQSQMVNTNRSFYLIESTAATLPPLTTHIRF